MPTLQYGLTAKSSQLILLYSEWPELHGVFAILSATGLNKADFLQILFSQKLNKCISCLLIKQQINKMGGLFHKKIDLYDVWYKNPMIYKPFT